MELGAVDAAVLVKVVDDDDQVAAGGSVEGHLHHRRDAARLVVHNKEQ